MKNSGNGLLGAALIGVGLGLTAIGVALVIPACTNWSLGVLDEAVRRGRDTLHSGVETAATVAGTISAAAQKKYTEASKTARDRTAKAAGVVEKAARHVREQASSEYERSA
jgi:hypothetical protein